MFSKSKKMIPLDDLSISSVFSYGAFYYLFNYIDKLKFSEKFINKAESNIPISLTKAFDCIKIMVINRILCPSSKLELCNWLELTPYKYFFDVDFDTQALYRALDVLNDNFEILEKLIYKTAVAKYKQNLDELFYDITSSYMEGYNCILAEYGYSKNHRRDKPQVVIGVITTLEGFPVKCKIFKGNTVDKSTVSDIVTEIKSEYKIDEFIFVGDRGMLTKDNIDCIKDLKQKFVMAIPRAWTKKYLTDTVIDETHMDKSDNPFLFVKEVSAIDDRLLLCLNVDKKMTIGLIEMVK
ncbi:MAG: IS1634 family transposase [Lachnospirales bacterium]